MWISTFQAGFKVVKILLNQEAFECLCDTIDNRNDEKIVAAALYAVYHILHSLQAVGKEEAVEKSLYAKATHNCVKILTPRAPLELFWVLFVLSCDAGHHRALVTDDVIGLALDTCTYEIFQVWITLIILVYLVFTSYLEVELPSTFLQLCGLCVYLVAYFKRKVGY